MIRKMIHSDIPQVAAIEKECFELPWSEKSLDAEVEKENSLFYVIVEDDLVIGYMGMYIVIDEGDITNIAITKDYRNLGHGKELIEYVISKANEKNIKKFTLEVRKSNISAINLYSKLGFVIEGVRKNFYQYPKEDGLIMWKY